MIEAHCRNVADASKFSVHWNLWIENDSAQFFSEIGVETFP